MAQAEKLFHEYSAKVGQGGSKEKGKPSGKVLGRAATKVLNEFEISREMLPNLVLKMGWEPVDDMMEMSLGMVAQTRNPGFLNWTEFLLFMKSYRDLEVDLFNARAGFSKDEVASYKETFE